jgi:hypothetical protein
MVPPLSVTRCSGMSVDDRVRRLLVELVEFAFRPADVARVLDDRHLHAEADAEERDLVLAGVADRLDLPFGAALAEAARHEHPSTSSEHRPVVPGSMSSSRRSELHACSRSRCRRGTSASLSDL